MWRKNKERKALIKKFEDENIADDLRTKLEKIDEENTGIVIKYDGHDKRIDVKLILEERVFHDSIFKVAGIQMRKADTLTVTYDLTCAGYVNGVKTSELDEKYSYTFEIKKDTITKYIRFTKIGDNASIQISNRKPGNLYTPKTWNATQVKE